MEISKEWQKLQDLDNSIDTMPPGDEKARIKEISRRIRRDLERLDVLVGYNCQSTQFQIERHKLYINQQYSLIHKR